MTEITVLVTPEMMERLVTLSVRSGLPVADVASLTLRQGLLMTGELDHGDGSAAQAAF